MRGGEFSARVYCDKTVGRVKMSRGTEVGLGLGDIVLDGDPAPLPESVISASPQRCGPCPYGQTVAHISNY